SRRQTRRGPRRQRARHWSGTGGETGSAWTIPRLFERLNCEYPEAGPASRTPMRATLVWPVNTCKHVCGDLVGICGLAALTFGSRANATGHSRVAGRAARENWTGSSCASNARWPGAPPCSEDRYTHKISQSSVVHTQFDPQITVVGQPKGSFRGRGPRVRG